MGNLTDDIRSKNAGLLHQYVMSMDSKADPDFDTWKSGIDNDSKSLEQLHKHLINVDEKTPEDYIEFLDVYGLSDTAATSPEVVEPVLPKKKEYSLQSPFTTPDGELEEQSQDSTVTSSTPFYVEEDNKQSEEAVAEAGVYEAWDPNTIDSVYTEMYNDPRFYNMTNEQVKNAIVDSQNLAASTNMSSQDVQAMEDEAHSMSRGANNVIGLDGQPVEWQGTLKGDHKRAYEKLMNQRWADFQGEYDRWKVNGSTVGPGVIDPAGSFNDPGMRDYRDLLKVGIDFTADPAAMKEMDRVVSEDYIDKANAYLNFLRKYEPKMFDQYMTRLTQANDMYDIAAEDVSDYDKAVNDQVVSSTQFSLGKAITDILSDRRYGQKEGIGEVKFNPEEYKQNKEVLIAELAGSFLKYDNLQINGELEALYTDPDVMSYMTSYDAYVNLNHDKNRLIRSMHKAKDDPKTLEPMVQEYNEIISNLNSLYTALDEAPVQAQFDAIRSYGERMLENNKSSAMTFTMLPRFMEALEEKEKLQQKYENQNWLEKGGGMMTAFFRYPMKFVNDITLSLPYMLRQSVTNNPHDMVGVMFEQSFDERLNNSYLPMANPEALKKDLINNDQGKMNWDAMLWRGLEQTGQVVGLLSGTSSVAKVGTAVGMGEMGAFYMGLGASTYTMVLPQYYSIGIHQGLSPREAMAYGSAHAAMEAGIEMLNPMHNVAGALGHTMKKRAMANYIANSVEGAKKMTKAQAFGVAMRNYGFNILGENVEEVLAAYGGSYINRGFNHYLGQERFNRDLPTNKELLETVILTTMATGVTSLAGIHSDYKMSLAHDGFAAVGIEIASNPELAYEALGRLHRKGKITDKQFEQYRNEITRKAYQWDSLQTNQNKNKIIPAMEYDMMDQIAQAERKGHGDIATALNEQLEEFRQTVNEKSGKVNDKWINEELDKTRKFADEMMLREWMSENVVPSSEIKPTLEDVADPNFDRHNNKLGKIREQSGDRTDNDITDLTILEIADFVEAVNSDNSLTDRQKAVLTAQAQQLLDEKHKSSSAPRMTIKPNTTAGKVPRSIPLMRSDGRTGRIVEASDGRLEFVYDNGDTPLAMDKNETIGSYGIIANEDARMTYKKNDDGSHSIIDEQGREITGYLTDKNGNVTGYTVQNKDGTIERVENKDRADVAQAMAAIKNTEVAAAEKAAEEGNVTEIKPKNQREVDKKGNWGNLSKFVPRYKKGKKWWDATKAKSIAWALNRSMPGASVHVSQKEWNAGVDKHYEGDPRQDQMRSEAFGFVSQNEDGTYDIYLNPEKSHAGTLVHEYGHIWHDLVTMAANNGNADAAKLLQKGRELAWAHYLPKVKEKYGNISDELAMEEALVLAIEDAFLEIEDEALMRNARAFMADFLNMAMEFFGLDGVITSQDRSDYANKWGEMTMEEWSTIVLADMFSGSEQTSFRPDISQGQTNSSPKSSIIGEAGAASLRSQKSEFLDMAKKMEKDGRSEADIWAATGWEKGVDGLWRADLGSALEVKETPPADKKVALSEVINNDRLFEAYPKLKDLKLRFGAKRYGSEMSASYDKGSNSILLMPVSHMYDQISRSEFQEVLTHEIQHAIQHIEGFEYGSNPAMFDTSNLHETVDNSGRPAGARAFNNEHDGSDIQRIKDEYISSNSLDSKESKPVYSLDKQRSKRIADAYAEMKHDPLNPEVQAAYKAMIDETIAQANALLKEGYTVELVLNQGEPYGNSSEMLKDLTSEKNLKILATESDFGSGITEKDLAENPLLVKSDIKDVNGKTLLANDVFRWVHDIFGHGLLGNGFGAIGEENAWAQHSMMYSPEARKAMTSETRGQNSWVNFSGVNDAAKAKMKQARKMHFSGDFTGGDIMHAEAMAEFKFADQKVGILPAWAMETYHSSPNEYSDMAMAEYESTAGEVEARNAVNRPSDLPISQTEDIKRYDQIKVGPSVAAEDRVMLQGARMSLVAPMDYKLVPKDDQMYTLRDSKNNTLIWASTEDVLNRLRAEDDRMISLGESSENKQKTTAALADIHSGDKMTPPYVFFFKEDLKIVDGRHWAAAVEMMGVGKIPLEVPKYQKKQFQEELNSVDPEVRMSIIGSMGAQQVQETAQSLSTAQAMLAEGINEDKIKVATGWELDLDGRWKLWVDPDEVMLKDINTDLKFQEVKPLSEVVDMPTAFKHYPQLKDLRARVTLNAGVSVKYYGTGQGAFRTKAFENQNEAIDLDAIAHSKEELIITIQHEIQHAIQALEGFAMGADYKKIRAQQEESYHELSKLMDSFNKEKDPKKANELRQEIIERTGYAPADVIMSEQYQIIMNQSEIDARYRNHKGEIEAMMASENTAPPASLKAETAEGQQVIVVPQPSIYDRVFLNVLPGMIEKFEGSTQDEVRSYIRSGRNSEGAPMEYNTLKNLVLQFGGEEDIAKMREEMRVSKIMDRSEVYTPDLHSMDKNASSDSQTIVPDNKAKPTHGPRSSFIPLFDAAAQSKAKKMWRKWMTINKGLGQAPATWIKISDGTKNAYMRRANVLGGELRKGVQNRMGVVNKYVHNSMKTKLRLDDGSQMSLRDFVLMFNDALSNPDKKTRDQARADLVSKATDLYAVMNSMRALADDLSIEIATSGWVTDDMNASITESLGIYMTRSYKAHDDIRAHEKWLKKTPEGRQVYEAAVKFIHKNYKEEYEFRWMEATIEADEKLEAAMKIDEQLQLNGPDAQLEKEMNDLLRESDKLYGQAADFKDLYEGWNEQKSILKAKELLGTDVSGGVFNSANSLSLDVDILKQRKDIPEPIRKLLGEYKDPITNFGRTIFNMSNFMASNRLLDDIVADGLANGYVYNEDNVPAEGFKKLHLHGLAGDRWNKKNLWVEEEVQEALNSMFSLNSSVSTDTDRALRAGYQTWMKFASGVKWGKTIGSPQTHARNVVGNTLFAAIAGHWDPTIWRNALWMMERDLANDPNASGLIKILGQTALLGLSVPATILDATKQAVKGKLPSMKTSLEGTGYSTNEEVMEDMIKLGIIDESVGLRELRESLKDAGWDGKVTDKVSKSFKDTVRKTIPRTMEILYGIEDNMFKAAAYMHEVRKYMEAFEGQADQFEKAKLRAAEAVNNQYPNYSSVSEAVKLSRMLPFTGTFVSFPAEVIRLTHATPKLYWGEFREGWKTNNKKLMNSGIKGLARMFAFHSMAVAAAPLLNYLGGITPGEEERMRKMLPKWMKNSQIVMFRNKEEGVYDVVDVSFLDPYSIIHKAPNYAIRRFNDDENLMDDAVTVSEIAAEIVAPFVSEDLLAERMVNVLRNQRDSRRQIYYNSDAMSERVIKSIDYMLDLAPGAVISGERLWKAATDHGGDFGRKYKLETELTALLTGLRINTYDVGETYRYKMQALNKDFRDAKVDQFNREVWKLGDATPEERLELRNKAVKIAGEYYTEMLELTDAAKGLGVPDQKVYQVIHETVTGKRVKNGLAAEYPWNPDWFMPMSEQDAIKIYVGPQ